MEGMGRDPGEGYRESGRSDRQALYGRREGGTWKVERVGAEHNRRRRGWTEREVFFSAEVG